MSVFTDFFCNSCAIITADCNKIDSRHQTTHVNLNGTAVEVVQYSLLPCFAIHVNDLDVGIAINKFGIGEVDGEVAARSNRIWQIVDVQSGTNTTHPV